ncbi:MAG: hypothetical protein QOE41_3207 [Mycobacterium sp.]|jgi:D-arabinose 1-dehydrogenase-like Zn-dependent alcohol dehydrogenase|nr:hypothetical protein [Mycobacterium sp.]MDT5133896.1 hypothetical protein [Mycobacterium sp.]
MTATVRSAQIPKVGGELRLVDLPPVEVGPEQVRVSVEACGIWHSDHKNISSQAPRCPPVRRSARVPVMASMRPWWINVPRSAMAP